jgi:hypothetical protein
VTESCNCCAADVELTWLTGRVRREDGDKAVSLGCDVE